MDPRVCICCGEAIKEKGNSLSRNPNLCACCSSLLDGMDEETSGAFSAPLISPRLSVDLQEPARELRQRAAVDVSKKNRANFPNAA